MDRSNQSAPLASSVHLDADIAAYEIEEFIDLIAERSIIPDDDNPTKLRELLSSNKRFMIVNAWRNINEEEPVLRAPLGLFLPNYTEANQTYPWARPDLETSRWYTFPRMTTDELLLFKQYDRRIDKISDIWHCALPIMEEDGEDAQPRRSLDLRAFCILKEEVAPEMDRFQPVESVSEEAEDQSFERQRRSPFVRSFVSKMKKMVPFIRR